MTIENIFRQLTESTPVKLADLPEKFGIYALWDHEGKIRYIGSTPKATEGFRTRIFSKHATGSEGRSHKFTQAYCTGRMFRFCKSLHDPKAGLAQNAADANCAKKLRNAFIRKHCTATFVEIPIHSLQGQYFAELTRLELALQAMAPASMRQWEGIKFQSVAEPSDLVDSLLREHPHFAEGATRQAKLYYELVCPITANAHNWQKSAT